MAEFFDNVLGNFNKGIKTISSKGNEFLETTRLKGEILETQQNIDKKFLVLGKKVYAMLNTRALNGEALKQDAGEITSLYKKITGLEEIIRKVEQEALKERHGEDAVKCVQCGVANKSSDKFCVGCGAAIIPADKTKDNSCSACGAELKEGAKFCSRCGGPVPKILVIP